MALVKRSENCKAATRYELRAPGHPRLRHSAPRSLNLVARNEAGAEIAEAALVLPLVFMFLLGIVWFGRAFNIYTTMTQAAQQGAITAARASCGTCGNTPAPDGDFSTPGTVVYAVGSVMQASSLDTGQIIVNSSPPTGCTTPSNITVCRNVQLNNAASAQPVFCTTPPGQSQLCGTLVSFQFPFQFYLPFSSLNQQRIVLTARAQSRMEQ
jgi:Flp pilus assembly protein TadG